MNKIPSCCRALAVLTILSITFNSNAALVTLDFEQYSESTQGIVLTRLEASPTPSDILFEDGFEIKDIFESGANQGFFSFGSSNPINYTGSVAPYNDVGDETRFALGNGGVFKALEIDLRNIDTLNPDNAIFTGFKADGTSVQQTFLLPQNRGFGNMQTYIFNTNFDSLKALSVCSPGVRSFQFDNVVLEIDDFSPTPVLLPGSLPLFVAGLSIFGMHGLRKCLRSNH